MHAEIYTRKARTHIKFIHIIHSNIQACGSLKNTPFLPKIFVIYFGKRSLYPKRNIFEYSTLVFPIAIATFKIGKLKAVTLKNESILVKIKYNKCIIIIGLNKTNKS